MHSDLQKEDGNLYRKDHAKAPKRWRLMWIASTASVLRVLWEMALFIGPHFP